MARAKQGKKSGSKAGGVKAGLAEAVMTKAKASPAVAAAGVGKESKKFEKIALKAEKLENVKAGAVTSAVVPPHVNGKAGPVGALAKPVTAQAGAGVKSNLPPMGLILAGLGITGSDLSKVGTIAVSARYLTFLLQTAFVKPEIVDLRWYEKHYLDVRAAVAAGKIASGEQHFHSSGWLEGRLPHEIDFDPVWYYKSYKDLQSVFAADDIAGLTKHFYTRGYFEGRAGTKECLASMQSWQLGQ